MTVKTVVSCQNNHAALLEWKLGNLGSIIIIMQLWGVLCWVIGSLQTQMYITALQWLTWIFSHWCFTVDVLVVHSVSLGKNKQTNKQTKNRRNEYPLSKRGCRQRGKRRSQVEEILIFFTVPTRYPVNFRFVLASSSLVILSACLTISIEWKYDKTEDPEQSCCAHIYLSYKWSVLSEATVVFLWRYSCSIKRQNS